MQDSNGNLPASSRLRVHLVGCSCLVGLDPIFILLRGVRSIFPFSGFGIIGLIAFTFAILLFCGVSVGADMIFPGL